jgi:hypothetical protein
MWQTMGVFADQFGFTPNQTLDLTLQQHNALIKYLNEKARLEKQEMARIRKR